MSDLKAQFPGRSQLPADYGPAFGENVTQRENERQLEMEGVSNAMKIAVGRHWLTEVSLDDVEAIGESGRRWRYQGAEYRLSEEYLAGHEDPHSVGVELFFIDRSGTARYLRRPVGSTGVGLSAAVRGGQVQGSSLVDLDGSVTSLGRPR